MYKPYNNPLLADLKQGWHEWHMDREWVQPVFTTIVTNCHKLPKFPESRNERISYGDGYLNELDIKASKRLTGCNYLKAHNYHKRHYGFLFREHVMTNLHYHGIIDIKQLDFDLYENVMKRTWFKICPSGSIKVRPVDRLYTDVKYVLKDQSGLLLSQHNSYFQFPNVSNKILSEISNFPENRV